MRSVGAFLESLRLNAGALAGRVPAPPTAAPRQIEEAPSWLPRAYMAAAAAMYIAGVIVLLPHFGSGIAVLSALPAIAAGWMWGPQPGLLAGLLTWPVNVLLFMLFGQAPGGFSTAVLLSGIPGTVVVTLLGVAAGRVRNIQHSLHSSGVRLRMLVEQMPAVLWTTDLELRFTSSAGAGLAQLGLRRNQVAGQTLFQYFRTDDPDFPPIAAHRRALSGSSSRFEVEWEGRTFQVEVEPLVESGNRIIGTIGVALDITERMLAEATLRQRDAQLEAQIRELAALAEASKALRGAESLQELAAAVATQAVRAARADAAFLHLVDEARTQVRIVGIVGVAPEAVGRTHLLDQGITGLVVRTGEPYHTTDLTHDPLVVHKDLVRGLGPAVCLPLRTSAGRVVGTLTIARRQDALLTPTPLDGASERPLSILVDIAGTALERVRTHEELEEAYVQAALALSHAMDARDAQVGHHSQRLAALAVATARELGCSDGEIPYLHWAAVLHDIGKLAVPDDILHKPGALSPEEWTIIARHPGTGASIVAPIRRLQAVAPIIRHHHERWDGAGYPDGLRETAIPLGARILAVVDAYVAMTEDRVYRAARTHEQAVAELRRNAGTQFDPQVVEVFCGVVESNETRASPPSRNELEAGLGVNAPFMSILATRRLAGGA